jgi:hypothetical protein
MSVLAFIPGKKTEIQKAAARGAKFLDEKQPGWADEIDLDSLQMVSRCNCIIGQITGTYHKGFGEIVNEGHDSLGPRASELGFILPKRQIRLSDSETWGRDQEWSDLGDAWAVEVLNRQ